MNRLLVASLLLFTLSASYVSAETAASAAVSKDEVRAQAVEICRTESERRYGDNSIKFIAGKSVWSKYLSGALVKMKVKPDAKNSKNYYCLVKADMTIDFITR